MDKETLRYLDLLLAIAKKGGLFENVSTSTVELSGELRSSQQSTSRKLAEMESLGLISRNTNQRGITVSLTDDGLGRLTFLRDELSEVVSPENGGFEGKVVSGLGEGRYYVDQQGYQQQFRKVLGYSPYPGTLNLQVGIARLKQFLHGKKQIVLKGFKGKKRTFGQLRLVDIKIIKGKIATKGCLLFPKRTTHPEGIAEIIAKDNLRTMFNLKDNDKIQIEGAE